MKLSVLTRRVPQVLVLTRSITTNAPKLTRVEEPHKKYNYQLTLRKQIKRRIDENLPFPSRVGKKYAWDVKDFVPVHLNGKDTAIYLIKKFRPSSTNAKESIKNAEERLGETLPEEYKIFLEQLEESDGIRNPVHIWSQNKVLLESEVGDALEKLNFAHELEPLRSLLERWNTNSGSKEAHEWQKYPATQIGTYGHMSLVIFLSDYQQYKKGSVYIFKTGTFEQLKLISNSFFEFSNSLFSVDEEEEYQEFIEKTKRRVDEKKRFKRLYNPKNFEYEGSPGSSKNHRYNVYQEAKNRDNKTTGKVSEKYEWEEWEWRRMMIGDRYTSVSIFEDQPPGLSSFLVEDLEKDLKMSLPADYKKFLSQYDGVSVKKPSHVWRPDGLVAFDDAISHIYGSDRIETMSKLVEDKKIENVKEVYPAIAIAGDDKNPKVFMFLQDHSVDGKDFRTGNVFTTLQNSEDKTKNITINLIADSFTEYCNNFLSDAEEEVYENNKTNK